MHPGFVDSLSLNSGRLGRQDIICSFLDSTQSLDLHSLSGTSNRTFCIFWIISNSFGLLRSSPSKLNNLGQTMQVKGGTTVGIHTIMIRGTQEKCDNEQLPILTISY